MSRDTRWLALLGCFFASGFAALLYQTAWTRLFGAVFGTSELAVATVLAAYMGGLAVGAAAAARLVGRVRRPVLAYGLLELGVGVAALAVPLAIRMATRLEVALLGHAELADAGGTASALFYLACAFAILGVPTALMGATLPLLARHAVRRGSELGRRVGTLYVVNTAGAIAGTLTAGFALLPALGLHGTVWVGVATNAGVFTLAAGLARGEPAAAPAPEPAPRGAAGGGAAAGGPAWILPLVAASGAVSFAYEVLWTRLLGHVLGGSVYAFAIMLASVLVGITLGGALAARLADAPGRAARGFAVAELATAALAAAAFRALPIVPVLAAHLGAGPRGGLAGNSVLAMAVLVPPALAIGATFPFAVRVLGRTAEEAGPAAARVYAWNTVGAITGSIAAGFVVLPALGFAGTLRAATVLNATLAAATALAVRPRAPRLAGLGVAAAAALVLLAPQEPWRLLRASPLSHVPARGQVVYYGVGRAATVLLLREPSNFLLRTNGLPESRISLRGSRPDQEALASWLGALPAVLRPEARRMLVVGLGGGVAVEHVPESVASIDVVELEPDVVAANRAVAGQRRRNPLADPRLRVRTNDARSALLLAATRYDAIVSQPSHPWSAGASHLYTREFFQLVRSRLAPGGVFVQWIGLGFVDARLLRGLVATLVDVFPEVEVYRPVPGGVLLAASDVPFHPLASTRRALAVAPDALAEVGIASPEDVAVARVLDAAGARALAAGAPVFTDDRNELATGSPRALAHPLLGPGADVLLAPYDPLRPPPADLDVGYLIALLAQSGQRARAIAIADSIVDPARRAAAQAVLAWERGDLTGAQDLADSAHGIDPQLADARALRLLARHAHADPGLAGPDPGGAAGGDPEAAVAAAWRLEAAGDPSGLRALDGRLAAVPATSLLEPEAVRLRARMRLATGGPEGARAALALLDPMVARIPEPALLALRAEAAAAAGEIEGSLAGWLELARAGAPASQRAATERGLALARSVRGGALGPTDRARWIRAFEAAAGGARRGAGAAVEVGPDS